MLVQVQSSGPSIETKEHHHMSRRTLILTPWMFPKQVVAWEDAVKLKYEGTAEVVVEYSEEVSSPSVTWKIPAVMRLKKLGKYSTGVRYSKHAMMIRDKFRCQYCSKKFPEKQLTRDHVHPSSRGGQTTWENTVAACRKCQIIKGSRTCDEIGMFPINWPVRPKVLQPAMPRLPEEIPEEWLAYVVDVR